MIISITTRIYSTDEKSDNVEHTVIISYTDPSATDITKEKIFTNDVDAMLTFITQNKDVEEIQR